MLKKKHWESISLVAGVDVGGCRAKEQTMRKKTGNTQIEKEALGARGGLLKPENLKKK